ncbi:MAG TPA: hypothetical protein VHA57_03485 [Actinomycetota bacterium]|nr:hypothetical protein [Actinomycetota bacterium]
MTMAARTKARSVPIAELRDRNEEYRRQRESTGVTISTDRQVFRMLEGSLRVAWCHELEDPEIIPRFEGEIRSGNIYTRRNLLTSLRAIVRRALGWGLVRSEPPFPDIVRLQTRDMPKGTRSAVPSRRDIDRLLEHLGSDESWEGRRLHALVATVALAGIGLAQALRLRVADVDLAGSTIWIPGGRAKRRNPDSRVVPVRIDDRLRPILAGWIRRTKCEWAFPGKMRVGPWHRAGGGHCDGPTPKLQAAARAAGIRKAIAFESLRRFHAENAASSLPYSHPTRPESATSDPSFVPAVEIGAPGEPAIVRGRVKRKLFPAQHEAVAALLEAWPGGLSLAGMNQKCKVGWRTTLVRLKKSDPDWDSAIAFPGKGFPGKDSDLYKIMPR